MLEKITQQHLIKLILITITINFISYKYFSIQIQTISLYGIDGEELALLANPV
jgi:hypothetical protein